MTLPPLPTGTNNKANDFRKKVNHRSIAKNAAAKASFSAVEDTNGEFDSANLAFLMTMDDGTNGGSDATDQSPDSRTITYQSTAQLVNTPVRSGKSLSLRAEGAEGIRIPLNRDIGTNDFCIEWWERTSAQSATWDTPVWAIQGSGGVGFLIFYQKLSANNFPSLDSSYFTQVNGTTDIPINTWIHHAVVREGTELRYYYNGVEEITQAIGASEEIGPNDTGVMWWGKNTDSPPSNFQHDAFFSDIRIVIGEPVYTANFTPPTDLSVS